MSIVRFSPANAKLEKLYAVRELKPYLFPKKKVYSFDLLSGYSCPSAKECQSFAMETKDGLKIKDGKYTKFRCYSASNEVIYKNAYNLRKKNLDTLKSLLPQGVDKIAEVIKSCIPKDAGIIRIHAAGDAFVKNYFLAWLKVIKERSDILFYQYTKQLKFWVDTKEEIESLTNYSITASRGGKLDHLIDQHNLREVKVVFSQYEAKKLGLRIDTTDEIAARPSLRKKNFALLLHGQQPKGKASKAWQRIKKTHGGYSK